MVAVRDGVVPWVEKYRPDNLDKIHGHEEILNTLQRYVYGFSSAVCIPRYWIRSLPVARISNRAVNLGRSDTFYVPP